MTLLLDTHAFLWFILNDPRLSPNAAALLIDPANELLLSPASYWEIAIKVSIGKLTLAEPFDSIFPKQLENNGTDVLDIKREHASKLVSLPFHHKDPFDRLLVAQALYQGWPILSHDPLITQYSVTTIW